MSETRCYRDGAVTAADFPLTELSAHLAAPGAVVWVDLKSGDEDALTTVGDQLGLHELAVEDARDRGQRPKLDTYRSHLFLTVYDTEIDASGAMTTSELAVFVTERALVTVGDGFDMTEVTRAWDESSLSADRVGVLLHGLLDAVVDRHLGAVSALDELLDDLEDQIFDDSADMREVQRHVVRLRRGLSGLRRVVLPTREVLTGLPRNRDLVDAELEPYFADVRDHAAHAAEWTDSLREHVTTLRETQLNIQGNRLDLIMKKVTGWAAIIAIPTAVTGFYGQNVPYPGSERPWGFWVSTAVIVGLSVGLYAMFKRKDWL
ncbi:magnesium transporter CorA family protein [Actinokineospora iranica]|uniref:Magnesium transporter n=1 Tax=Actinokineospora iranica TaxID=1271860 RepID=A0A1G6WI00_9PSEU|nr:magnesium transporter CorA family protein [Actinokineospora iranica]SDD65333.1 magnesium transporter [Actinokineospora iranica]